MAGRVLLLMCSYDLIGNFGRSRSVIMSCPNEWADF